MRIFQFLGQILILCRNVKATEEDQNRDIPKFNECKTNQMNTPSYKKVLISYRSDITPEPVVATTEILIFVVAIKKAYSFLFLFPCS